jgi:RNA polymerase sigma factor (sigma-70 family)
MIDLHETRASLLVRIRDRQDNQAWSQFVEIYSPLIYGFGRKHGLQDADAVDLMQEVLRIVARTAERFEYDAKLGSFRGWLFTIVRNEQRTWQARRLGDADEPVTPALPEAINAAKELEATIPSVKLPPHFLQAAQQPVAMRRIGQDELAGSLGKCWSRSCRNLQSSAQEEMAILGDHYASLSLPLRLHCGMRRIPRRGRESS